LSPIATSQLFVELCKPADLPTPQYLLRQNAGSMWYSVVCGARRLRADCPGTPTQACQFSGAIIKFEGVDIYTIGHPGRSMRERPFVETANVMTCIESVVTGSRMGRSSWFRQLPSGLTLPEWVITWSGSPSPALNDTVKIFQPVGGRWVWKI